MDRSKEYITKVAELKSIKQAANKLYVTPSALSKLIKNKEEELGVRLFDRVGKKFELTYAGERYVDWARKILIMENEMIKELQGISHSKIGKVKLGFQMMQTDLIISGIIPIFKSKFPNIEVILFSHTTNYIINMLKENKLDLAVLSTKKQFDECNYDLLYKQEMVLAVPAGHPLIDLAEKKEGHKYKWIDLKYLKKEKFIMLFPDQEYRIYSDNILKEHGIKPSIAMQVPTVELSLKCVSSGHGITITIDNPITFPAYEKVMVPLSFGEKKYTYDTSLVSNKYHELQASAKYLAEILNDYCQSKF